MTKLSSYVYGEHHFVVILLVIKVDSIIFHGLVILESVIAKPTHVQPVKLNSDLNSDLNSQSS